MSQKSDHPVKQTVGSNHKTQTTPLNTLDTIGHCQRPDLSLGVSQHNMHKITILVGLNWSSKLQENTERKTPMLHKMCVLSEA